MSTPDVVGKSPINWYGGKIRIAKKIIALFPEHETYCEVFGGSGGVLFAKRPSAVDVFNDINSDVVTFFKVLRDPEKAERLKTLLTLTPYSREEFEAAKCWYMHEPDDVERVRQWYVTVMQSFSAKRGAWSYSISASLGGMSHSVHKYLKRVDSTFAPATERLLRVQIEHLDFRDFIPRYDRPSTLFYLDPPYVLSVRERASKKVYTHEMTDKDHENLLNLVINVKGKVILSGYDSELYERLLNQPGWCRVSLGMRPKTVAKKIGEKRLYGEEWVWCNYVPVSL